MPFQRFLDRSFLIIALAGLWPLLRALGAVSWRELGLPAPHGQGKKFLAGLSLGCISLLVVAGIALGSRERTFGQPSSAHAIVGAIFGAIGTAAAVGTLEEILFRGGIFGGLRKLLYWPLALAVSSVVYSLAHFLHRAEFSGTVGWNSGLILLPRMFVSLADLQALIPGFLSLTLAGVLLGLAYQRTGNLYFSIGLHAGWVFVLKLYNAFTVQTPNAALWFWGTGKMTDGWLAFLALAFTLAIFTFLPLDDRRARYAINP
jgi:membrane protease YdiL (CAAX protease family)